MDKMHSYFTAPLLQYQLIFISLTFFYLHISSYSTLPNTREALEIVIGIPGNTYNYPPPTPSPQLPDCPPPPPPPVPPPQPPSHPPPYHPPSPLYVFESKRIEIVYSVIQNFKKKITYDPFGITKTWVGPNICKDYKGFYCDICPAYNMTAVAGVDFNGYHFSGLPLLISGFIDHLPDIAFFHANSNNFSGEIPKNISKLRFLYELDLSNNLFSGQFPYNVLGAGNITLIDLRFNSFSGLLPAQVFSKYLLDVFFINNNNLVQTLPDNLGSTRTRYLTLANNKFVGAIPRSIGYATELVEILLLNNGLSGCLPYELGLLNNLTLFDASQNKLTGLIPYSLACLGQIEILNLAQNELYGPVPEVICKLPNLKNLSLSYNYFSSVGPTCRSLIMKNGLDVRMNCIVGLPAQRSQAECRAFYSRPKCCNDDEKVYSWIPCKKITNSDQEPSDHGAGRSYGALIPHKL